MKIVTKLLSKMLIFVFIIFILYSILKASKLQDLGQVDFDEEIKKRHRIIYIPNWFSVDLKTGVCLILFSVKFK